MTASTTTNLRLLSVQLEARDVSSWRPSDARQGSTFLRAQRTHPPLTNDTTITPSRSYQRHSRTCELDLYAMANVQPKTTGLPMTIYISNKNARHGPRIKVSQQYGNQMNASELFSMTIEEDPRIIGKPGRIRVSDIGKVNMFIQANRELLLDYWRQEPPLDTLDMLLKLTKV